MCGGGEDARVSARAIVLICGMAFQKAPPIHGTLSCFPTSFINQIERACEAHGMGTRRDGLSHPGRGLESNM